MKRLLVIVLLFAFTAISYADKTYSVDVVVVGAGTGGLAASVAALDAGFSVILLEKLPAVGGSGNYMEGTFALNSAIQKAAGLGKGKTEEQLIREAFNTQMNFHHWRIDPLVLKAWLKKTPTTIQWLQDRGVKFERVISAFRAPYPTWHIFGEGSGSSYVKIFSQLIPKQGGIILTETPANDLIIKNGQAAGVIAKNTDTGEIVTVNAGAVILATGGFSGNKEMIEKYARWKGYETIGSKGRTGDGIKMAEKAGAKLVNMETMQAAGQWLPMETDEMFGRNAPYLLLLTMAYNRAIWVNMHGKRIFNEDLPIEYASLAAEKSGGIMFNVFDDNMRKVAVEQGIPNGFAAMVPPGVKYTDFEKHFSEGAKRGFTFKANTLDELAKLTGMDTATLKASIDANNKRAKTGIDDEFYRDGGLRTIDKAPYYAIKTTLRMFATLGGPAVNENMNVINTKDIPIRGLYAIGQDGSGVIYGDSYDMHVAEGTTSSYAINGGRIAVDHIKTWLKPLKK